jgi:hypothetical protein
MGGSRQGREKTMTLKRPNFSSAPYRFLCTRSTTVSRIANVSRGEDSHISATSFDDNEDGFSAILWSRRGR